MLLGGIEAGGTKFVCGVGDITGSRRTIRIDTRDPATTLAAAIAFFHEAQETFGRVDAVGIGSFGPLQLDPARPGYGRITTTPKPGWAGVDMPAQLSAAIGAPVAIDTDVNAAALAEARIGAGRGAASLAYVTVGTGVGVGLVIGGQTVHGRGHPEAGHVLVRLHPAHAGFAGICPYHGDCLEGLASGPAIAAAWGHPLNELPADHPAHAVEADYLAQLCMNLILTVSPDHVVLGGGVMSGAGLIEDIRRRTATLLNGYCAEWTDADFTDRITPPGCVEPPGLIGAYMLAAALSQA